MILRITTLLLGSPFLLACAEGESTSPLNDRVEDDDQGSDDDDAADDDSADDDAADDDAADDDDDAADDDAAGGSGNSPGPASGGSGGDGPLENPSPPSCEAGEPGAFEPPLPTPRISLGKPVVASEGVENPEAVVDGDYHNTAAIARFPESTEDSPSWVSIDLGEGPSRVLAVWQDASFALYNNPKSGSPLSYRIETSGDSTDGEDGEWTVSEEVEDNPLKVREHAVAFAGQRWLRFVFTGMQEGSTTTTINIDEIAVHDISDVDDTKLDTWFFLGDSITLGAFKRDLNEASMFDEVVAASSPGHFPVFIGGGIGGEFVSDGLARIDQALELYPNVRYVAVAFGTNDAWGNKSVGATTFEARLVELVERILDAGRVPVLARIPYAFAAHTTLPDFNAVIDQVREDYQLPCGPDLYGWFFENQGELSDDDVHPIQLGYISINRSWAEMATRFYDD